MISWESLIAAWTDFQPANTYQRPIMTHEATLTEVDLGSAQGKHVNDSLRHRNPTEPAMDQVEVVERDVQ